MSITQWACKIMENTVKKGFHEEVTNSLKYLLADVKLGQPILPTSADFEELVRECTFFGGIQLNAEDETKAYHEPGNYHLTDSFELQKYILEQINLSTFYRELFKISKNRTEVMTLFGSHLKATCPG